ncbi:hypothetical protein RB594_000186 [Gaeumannomyces avenae]
MPALSVPTANATWNGTCQQPANGSRPGADTSSDSHGGTVSRAEVFGIFLTLSLCLLSQPTGSLVYRPRSILPWRLNPLASLAEAVLVLSCFAAIIVPLLFGLAIDCTFDLDSSWVTSRTEIGDLSTFRGRWCHRAKLARAARLRLRVETHALAAALLLIRGDKGQKSQKTASGVMDLVAELAASGLFPEENQGVDTNEEATGLMAAGARGGETSRQDENGAPAVVEDESRQIRSAGADPSRRQEQTTVSTATSPPDTRPSQVADGSSNSDRAALLRRVYGSNVLAHREFPVQMVTLLSVTSVAVKLCVSSLPGPLVASGALMLLSWMTIQLLLLVFHSRNLQDTGLQALSTAVQEFSPVFDQSPSDETQWAVWPWLAVCFAVGIPLSSLILYGSIPVRYDAPTPTILHKIAGEAIRAFGTGFLVVIVWANALGLMEKEGQGAGGAQNETRRDGQGVSNGAQQSASLLARSFGAAIFTILAALALWADSVWGNDTTYILPYICWTIITGISTILTLIFASTLLSAGTHFLPVTDGAAILIQRLLLFLAAYAFATWMLGYDETLTSQPDWVKWLG